MPYKRVPKRKTRKPKVSKKIQKVAIVKGATHKKARAKQSSLVSTLPRGPFSNQMNTVLVYKSPADLALTSVGFSTTFCRMVANGLFDFDYDNILSNKQPLYFDQLLSSTGPYRRYRVNAWSISLKVMNTTDYPCEVFYDPGTFASINDTDTLAEISNRPKVIYKYLSGVSGAKPYVNIKSYRTLASIATPAGKGDNDWIATYAANPSLPIYATLFLRTIDGVSVPSARVSVSAKFYITCFDADAVSS